MFLKRSLQLWNRLPRTNCRSLMTTQTGKSIFEPDYLESLKSKYPVYESINIQIKGYDYTVLESYQKFIHRVADTLDLDVSDGWAVPPQSFQVQRLRPDTAITDAEYKLTVYERAIQISEVGAPIYSMLLRFAQAGLPEGVTLNVVPHTDEYNEIRYVPDGDLKELKQQLDDLGGPTVSKKR